MENQTDLVTELLVTNTALNIRLAKTVSALLTVLRKTVPDFEKQYIAALFPREEPELSKLLTELAETAQKLAQASRQPDKP